MWLSKALLFCVLALAACGFTPAYAPGGPAANLQNAILADEPRDKPAFDLVERLEERLGPSDVPRFALSYKIKLDSDGVGISTDNATTRYHLVGRVDWQLTDLASGAQVTGGQARSFTAYSATGSTVAGLAAEEDASLRLMRILADQIVSQILATSANWSGAQ
ncbi:LPS assembly lipoprotein LptE [Pseudorhodobacter aquimaris]|uniref:LPS assembly lipoprotein LptE n=1 Tax=Pseudorhodobacter aquimaris TaxID=687412 RepID=UPI00067AC863|nr:LPS assembly lipoprotein LptE [Pseudorhodobacter aquimaris]